MLTVINPREAITTTIKLCEALQTLHDRGIVHCDVKPLNIIIRSPGDPVLIDLGMARFIGEKFPEEEIVVSPLYSAPELYTATKVDGRVDVYSLGITLLHMLTGLPRIENLVLGENVVTRDDGYQERIYDTMAGPELRFLDLPSKEILQKHTEAGLNQVHPLLLQIILEEAIAPADQRIATAELFGRRLQNFLA